MKASSSLSIPATALAIASLFCACSTLGASDAAEPAGYDDSTDPRFPLPLASIKELWVEGDLQVSGTESLNFAYDLHLHEFFAIARGLGFCDQDMYLAAIELGPEIWREKGSATFKNLKADLVLK